MERLQRLRRPTRTAILSAVATALAVVAPATGGADPIPTDQQRQHAFAAAAAEFGVPESVLLGVT
jgi:hypothetical protein